MLVFVLICTKYCSLFKLTLSFCISHSFPCLKSCPYLYKTVHVGLSRLTLPFCVRHSTLCLHMPLSMQNSLCYINKCLLCQSPHPMFAFFLHHTELFMLGLHCILCHLLNLKSAFYPVHVTRAVSFHANHLILCLRSSSTYVTLLHSQLYATVV